VAGAVGAHLQSTAVLVVGLACLLANGFAPAARNFTAARKHSFSPKESPLEAARVTFTACTVFGLIPLVAYPAGLTVCTLAAAPSFFVIGVMKSRSLRIEWWRSGLDNLFIGLSAAALAFGAGHTLQAFISAH
jgi:VIT1/CCC1 family predicted Fe2+/Mn2+ transporter